jgi:hypothetical protein
MIRAGETGLDGRMDLGLPAELEATGLIVPADKGYQGSFRLMALPGLIVQKLSMQRSLRSSS